MDERGWDGSVGFEKVREIIWGLFGDKVGLRGDEKCSGRARFEDGDAGSFHIIFENCRVLAF